MALKNHFFLFEILKGNPIVYIYLSLIIFAAIIAIYTKRGFYFALGFPIAALITLMFAYLLKL